MKSRRARLWEAVESGYLRQVLEHNGPAHGIDFEVTGLIVDIAARYCEPRRSSRRHA